MLQSRRQWCNSQTFVEPGELGVGRRCLIGRHVETYDLHQVAQTIDGVGSGVLQALFASQYQANGESHQDRCRRNEYPRSIPSRLGHVDGLDDARSWSSRRARDRRRSLGLDRCGRTWLFRQRFLALLLFLLLRSLRLLVIHLIALMLCRSIRGSLGKHRFTDLQAIMVPTSLPACPQQRRRRRQDSHQE